MLYLRTSVHISHFICKIVWNSPMQELIGSLMVSSLLLPAFGTLSLLVLLPAFGTLSFLVYIWLPSTFLSSKGRSIITRGTRWHDFFFFIFLLPILDINFYSFYCFSFPFPKECRLKKGHIVLILCSHLFKKKKKKKKKRRVLIEGTFRVQQQADFLPLPTRVYSHLTWFSFSLSPQ